MFAGIDITIVLFYLLLGSFSGIFAGLLGVGGGIIIVPTLFYLFALQDFPAEILMHLSVATSLATIVFTAISSTYAHHRKGAVLWPKVVLLVPGILVGSVLGAVIATQLPSDILKTAFGLFLCIVALQIGMGFKPSPHRNLPDQSGLMYAGGGIGGFSTLLGTGGGSLMVPFLLWCNVNIRNAVATSSACGLPISFAGSLAMVWVGWGHHQLPIGATGYVYWPAVIGIVVTSMLFAPLGAGIAHMLPVQVLRRVFAVFLAIIGIRMLV